MPNRRCWGLAATLGLMLVFGAVRADDNGLAESKSDRNEFVVGDWYDVSVERHGVKEQLTGMLVKATDDWIVLGQVSASAYDDVTGTPILMHLPFVGSRFRKTNRKEVMYKDYRWIPRDAVHLEKRHEEIAAKIREEFKDDTPTLNAMCRMAIVNHGKHEEIGVDKDKAKEKTFGDDDAVIREMKNLMPFDTVLYIESQVALTPKQVALVNSE
jgi:hypothetical protein